LKSYKKRLSFKKHTFSCRHQEIQVAVSYRHVFKAKASSTSIARPRGPCDMQPSRIVITDCQKDKIFSLMKCVRLIEWAVDHFRLGMR